MFILKKGHQPGVYVPLRALFLVKMGPNLPPQDSFYMRGIYDTYELSRDL